MDNSYFLEVDIGEYHPVTQRMAFETKADAVAQLDLIEPMLGHGKFRNDPEKNRHRISGPDGEMVVVVEHIRAVRVVDRATFDSLASYAYDSDAVLNGVTAERIAKVAAATMHALQKADAVSLLPLAD